jgi:hypothetical protein
MSAILVDSLVIIMAIEFHQTLLMENLVEDIAAIHDSETRDRKTLLESASITKFLRIRSD